MKWRLERYKRQLGLVHQQQIMDMDILLLGDGPVLPYVALNLVLVGVGSGKGRILLPADGRKIDTNHIRGQFLFKRHDAGADFSMTLAEHLREFNRSTNIELVADTHNCPCDLVIVTPGELSVDSPSNRLTIWGGVTNYGIYLGANRPQIDSPFSTNILTPSLASICGAMVAQEAIRVTKSLRVSDIQKFWMTLNYSMLNNVEGKQFVVNGFEALPIKDAINESTAIYRIPIDLSSDTARVFLENTYVVEDLPALYYSPKDCFYYSPFFQNRLDGRKVVELPVELPTELSDKKVVIGGVGGLGTWLAALLAVSNYKGEILIFDSDNQIEEHNLNRQILYNDKVIGQPKVEVAMKALRELNNSITLRGFQDRVEDTVIITHESAMKRADLAITTFDNFLARYVFSQWAASENVPLVNGGVFRFEGAAELVVPERNGCLFCIWEKQKGPANARAMSKSNQGPSCGKEDSDSPDIASSIVTSISTVGSLQALLSVVALINPSVPFDHDISYFGKENSFEKCRLTELFSVTKCPIHERGPCGHPQEFYAKVTSQF